MLRLSWAVTTVCLQTISMSDIIPPEVVNQSNILLAVLINNLSYFTTSINVFPLGKEHILNENISPVKTMP